MCVCEGGKAPALQAQAGNIRKRLDKYEKI